MAKDYNISKTRGLCVACEEELAVGQEFMATVQEVDGEFQRHDYCLKCWIDKHETEPPDALALWRTHVPEAEEKKKLFVDDGLLIDFFERLGGSTDDAKVSFRYVLALVLMRKRLLIYDRNERGDDGAEVWLMHLKGNDRTCRVIDPKMDEEMIVEVSGQIGQILEGEL